MPASRGDRRSHERNLLDSVSASQHCSPYSIERISISWSPARTLSPAALPIRARATGETYEIDPFRGSASSSPTILNAWRLPSSRLNATRCLKATARDSVGGGTICAVLRRSAKYLISREATATATTIAGVLDPLRGVISSATFRHRMGQRFQSQCGHQIRMGRDRAIRQLDLRGRFGAFFSGEGHAHCFDFPFSRRSLPRQAMVRGRALTKA